MNTHTIREIVVKYRRPKKASEQLTDPSETAALVRKIIQGDSREHFIVIHLDGTNKPCSYSVAAIGQANVCSVHPREIFQPAILAGSVAVIFAHNHPSGNVTPSKQDKQLTEDLTTAAKYLGIKILDHLVVTETEHRSVMY
jgi:DNA repair protein RadC